MCVIELFKEHEDVVYEICPIDVMTSCEYFWLDMGYCFH